MNGASNRSSTLPGTRRATRKPDHAPAQPPLPVLESRDHRKVTAPAGQDQRDALPDRRSLPALADTLQKLLDRVCNPVRESLDLFRFDKLVLIQRDLFVVHQGLGKAAQLEQPSPSSVVCPCDAGPVWRALRLESRPRPAFRSNASTSNVSSLSPACRIPEFPSTTGNARWDPPSCTTQNNDMSVVPAPTSTTSMRSREKPERSLQTHAEAAASASRVPRVQSAPSSSPSVAASRASLSSCAAAARTARATWSTGMPSRQRSWKVSANNCARSRLPPSSSAAQRRCVERQHGTVNRRRT